MGAGDRRSLLPLLFMLSAAGAPAPWWTVQLRPSTLKALEGDTVELQCTFFASNGQLLAQVSLFKGPERVPVPQHTSAEQGRVSREELPRGGLPENTTGFSFKIQDVSVCDSGTYLCQVDFFGGPLLNGTGATLRVHRREEEKAPGPEVFHTALQLTRICLLLVLICLASYLIVISRGSSLHPRAHRHPVHSGGSVLTSEARPWQDEKLRKSRHQGRTGKGPVASSGI
ncbi:uncharacterized protein LOC115081446 [Rhinatrema bivittatum]|uniref:uncharacterized protein LOC115081446 n=1 Tax=Rhinatrema bivittatum TaxID=194408 RepID=UPI00112A933E|nr:uncharacterized protein LOC115081446 [Rhinatrema bivittatum]